MKKLETQEMVPAVIPATVVELPTEQEVFGGNYLTTLQELGFGKAVTNLGRAQKLQVAYSKYQFVTEEAIAAFNSKLRAETLKEDAHARSYKRLEFIKPQDYGMIPPMNVLAKMKEAIADGIFDAFVIAKINWVKEVKDPILFGTIDGCSDRFFVAQWDDDVSIEDILTCKPR